MKIASVLFAASLVLLSPTGSEATVYVAALCDAPVAIHFNPGSTSGKVSGGIARGELACLTISAKSGQIMMATVSSMGTNAVIQIYAPGWTISQSDGYYDFKGMALNGAAEGDDASQWKGPLPTSGKFLFVLGNTRGGGDYTLTVSVTDAP